MKKRILSALTAFIMLAAYAVIPTASAETQLQLGDYVQMGTYYGEPILWRCVSFEKISGYDSDGNPIIDSTDTVTEYQEGYLPLMLSDKIICLKPFDESGNDLNGSHSRNSERTGWGSNYWADSNIRSWLNSNESAGNVEWLCGNPPSVNNDIWGSYNDYADEAGFLTNFTQDELSVIKSVTQKSIAAIPEYENGIYDNGSEPHEFYYYVDGVVANYESAYSEQVTDTIFFLDVKQVNTVYSNSDVLGEDYYIGEPTKQCVAYSEYVDSQFEQGSKWDYWLRSPSNNDEGIGVRCVYYNGGISRSDAYYWINGIRPAFYLSETAVFDYGRGTEEDPYTTDSEYEWTYVFANASLNYAEEEDVTYLEFDINKIGNAAARTVVAANYSANGELISIISDADQSDVETESWTVELDDGAAYVKVFIWDDTTNAAPLAEPLAVDVANGVIM